MKISNINNYMNYKSNNINIKKNDVTKSKKFDTIQINKSAREINENQTPDINTIKKQLLSDINIDHNVDRIEQIKQQIENNTYDVNTKELAQILLNL